ncbi:N-acyl amino acid synthase FeeM domain-containing protein [Roseateles koreensis]|uniref:N-acyl amino acid synthase FeeM domain-containing protein n=1 Tax=Roseateles koreensis TaxID=2987526 RepID=UPI00235985A6|nr:hypothetical protein [Roseateles koreensis]
MTIQTAQHEHWGQARGLVARRYADRGYLCNDLSTQPDGAEIICSAFEGACTVGTIAVRFDDAHGLRADAIFANELHALRAEGLRLCEFGRLALDHDIAESKGLLGHLFHVAYLHAHRLACCNLLVIEVNPRHVAFYRRMLGFKVHAEARLNPRVNAPAVLMTLDLIWAREQIGRLGGSAAGAQAARTLYSYFYDAAAEAALLAKLRQ